MWLYKGLNKNMCVANTKKKKKLVAFETIFPDSLVQDNTILIFLPLVLLYFLPCTES